MKLSEALSQYEEAEFQYGTLDCCLFVANVIKAVTGKDFATPWRGRYDTEFGALRMIAEHKNIVGIASAAFGKMRPIWSVKEGDPVLLPPEAVEHDSIAEGLGIYDGRDLVCMTEKGMVRMPILAGKGCWNV